MRKEKDKMADFFGNLKGNLESLGKTISEKAEVVAKKTEEAVEVVAKKTEETVEVQKIKSQIRVMERNNERDFQDIGKIVYERYQKGKEIDAEFVELCEAISEREESIDNYKKQVAEIRGLDVCPSCKAHVEANVVFCPKCGAKIEEECCDEDEFEDEDFKEVAEETEDVEESEATEEVVDE